MTRVETKGENHAEAPNRAAAIELTPDDLGDTDGASKNHGVATRKTWTQPSASMHLRCAAFVAASRLAP
jgi:hypothetical protein